MLQLYVVEVTELSDLLHYDDTLDYRQCSSKTTGLKMAKNYGAYLRVHNNFHWRV